MTVTSGRPLLLNPELLSRILSFPTDPLPKGMAQLNSSGLWAFQHTATLVPAFLRIGYDGWFTLFWIWHKNISLADFHTSVAAIANVLIEYYRFIRRCSIRSNINFFFRHDESPCDNGFSPIMDHGGLCSFLKEVHRSQGASFPP
jgi:hypothetical protein